MEFGFTQGGIDFESRSIFHQSSGQGYPGIASVLRKTWLFELRREHRRQLADSEDGDCIIGLFQGMFEKNMLTFNPGWDSEAQEVNPFKDVRTLQEELRSKGLEFVSEVDVNSRDQAVS
jgi:hypothetical protein